MNPSLAVRERKIYNYDIWAQCVAPLACIVIVLFAIPAGVATGRQSVFKGVLCAIAMFFSFYALTIGCMALAKTFPSSSIHLPFTGITIWTPDDSWLPAPVAALLPNIVFTGIGLWQFHKQR